MKALTAFDKDFTDPQQFITNLLQKELADNVKVFLNEKIGKNSDYCLLSK